MINCELKRLFVWNFHNKIVLKNQSNTFWAAKEYCVIKPRKMFIFLPLIVNSVTICNHIIKYDQYFTFHIYIVFLIFS